MAELKRTLLVLLVCLALPPASAQGVFYLGFRSSAITPLYSTNAPLLLGLQLGVPLTERLGVRAALDGAPFFRSVIQADLLYSQPLGGGVRWYVGAGPDYSTYGDFTGVGTGASYGIHATLGVERVDAPGLFAEVQPAFAFEPATFWGRLGFGLNIHF